MDEAIDKAIADLENTRAGWVTRRDAAEALGKAARRALAALEAHADDTDVDIRTAVTQALASFTVPEPAPLQQQSLKDLVEPVARPGHREVIPEGSGYAVQVQLKTGRAQKVLVQPHTRKDGQQLLRIFTWCGPGDPERFAWLLQSNAKLVHSAFALIESEAGERVALVKNLPWQQATTDQLKNAVKETAFYGDWLEQKITGRDDF